MPQTPTAEARFLRDTVRDNAAPCTTVLVVTVLLAATELALPALCGHTLDLLLTGRHAEAGAWLALCAGLTGAAAVLGAVDGLVTSVGSAQATAWIRKRTLGHLLRCGRLAGERFAHGDLVARLIGNAAQAGTVPVAVAALLAAAVTPLGGLAFLLLTDVWTALVVLAGLPVLLLLLTFFARAFGDCGARYLHAQGEVAGRLTEALSGARTIAAAGTYQRDAARVLAPMAELSRQGHRLWRTLGRSNAQSAALVQSLQIAVLVVAGLRVAAGELSVGGLLAAWRYAVLATGTGALISQVSALARARNAATRLDEVLAQPVTAYGPIASLPPGKGTVEFIGVTFRRANRDVLRDIDLRLPGGTAVAVVGRSGSGKSALAALAGRLADPDAGAVLLDGVPLASLTRETLRHETGYAFERPALLGRTIRDTIAIGAYDPGETTVVEAARAACADDFVRRLPDGYGTACTRAPLSGGEAQRLGLARAFAHAGRLLVLDDATSSLDAVTELKVSRALLHGDGARTCLIIAHRVSTAARAGLVVWLEDGQVRAVGPHARLARLAPYRAVFAGEAVDAS
ncbi:ABC transporter ATP-binding protein [Streptomyces sp. L2]|uniref:ABC transporter ATP-binding protein n=1 Tax=Streptomyces sp. L2 TaxID=2162665 RepID=UPI001012B05D|nr:ABC transporter ATP-binding protein [Streptomyces sp. L2]